MEVYHSIIAYVSLNSDVTMVAICAVTTLPNELTELRRTTLRNKAKAIGNYHFVCRLFHIGIWHDAYHLYFDTCRGRRGNFLCRYPSSDLVGSS